MTGRSHGYGFGIDIPHTGSICSDRGCLDFLENNIGYLQNQHRLFPPPTVSELHKVFCRGWMGSLSDSPIAWRRIPHHRSSQPFYLHGLGLILFTHETTCLPLACVPLTIWKSHVIPKELRIKKHIIHMSFGIILKYYSQGLKPLGLSPLPTFQPLIPFPLCGSLVPHHSFIMVGLHMVVFMFY
jgi:hypothetical protein